MVWAALAALIPAAINLVRGISQENKGKRLAARNKLDPYEQQGQFEDMYQFYAKNAMYGLSPQSMSFITSGIDKGFTSSLRAMQVAGGDPNAAAGAYDSYTGAYGQTGLTNEQLQQGKIAQMGQAWQQLISGKESDWLRNFYYPWANQAQLASSMMNAGYQSTSNALDTASAVALNAATTNYKPQEDDDPNKGPGNKKPYDPTPYMSKPTYKLPGPKPYPVIKP